MYRPQAHTGIIHTRVASTHVFLFHSCFSLISRYKPIHTHTHRYATKPLNMGMMKEIIESYRAYAVQVNDA